MQTKFNIGVAIFTLPFTISFLYCSERRIVLDDESDSTNDEADSCNSNTNGNGEEATLCTLNSLP